MSGAIDTRRKTASTACVKLTYIEKLLIIRRRLGLTRCQAAARWGLPARSMRAWEEGTRGISDTSLARIKEIITIEEVKK